MSQAGCSLLVDDAFGAVEIGAPEEAPEEQRVETVAGPPEAPPDASDDDDDDFEDESEQSIENLGFYKLITGASNFRQDMVYNLVKKTKGTVIRLTPSTMSAEETVIELINDMFAKNNVDREFDINVYKSVGLSKRLDLHIKHYKGRIAWQKDMIKWIDQIVDSTDQEMKDLVEKFEKEKEKIRVLGITDNVKTRVSKFEKKYKKTFKGIEKIKEDIGKKKRELNVKKLEELRAKVVKDYPKYLEKLKGILRKISAIISKYNTPVLKDEWNRVLGNLLYYVEHPKDDSQTNELEKIIGLMNVNMSTRPLYIYLKAKVVYYRIEFIEPGTDVPYKASSLLENIETMYGEIEEKDKTERLKGLMKEIKGKIVATLEEFEDFAILLAKAELEIRKIQDDDNFEDAEAPIPIAAPIRPAGKLPDFDNRIMKIINDHNDLTYIEDSELKKLKEDILGKDFDERYASRVRSVLTRMIGAEMVAQSQRSARRYNSGMQFAESERQRVKMLYALRELLLPDIEDKRHTTPHVHLIHGIKRHRYR